MPMPEIPDEGSPEWVEQVEIRRRAKRLDEEVVSGKARPPKLWKATDLKGTAQPKFLARNRIPQSAITVLIGEEGLGKSLLWVMLAAAITTGKPLPEFELPARDPAYVHLAITEDDWATTVRPRLEVAGADLDYVRVICEDVDGSGAPTFPKDMPTITEADPAPVLVVVDAWLDTVPQSMQVRNPQHARSALHPWREAANATGAAVLLLTHSNRVGTANIRDRYGATAALRQKARMTLYCLGDGEGHLIVGPDKANGASNRTHASIFRILPVQHFEPTDDHDGTVPRLVFVQQSDRTITQHLQDEMDADKARARPATDAEVWLREYLEDGDGKRMANDVYTAGKESEHEFSKDQLKRAKKKIHAVAVMEGDAWAWKLMPARQIKFNLIKGEGGADAEIS